MPDFPEIGCQAVVQYPASVEILTPTVIQQYVDGSEQRFPSHTRMRRTWTIRLQRLDEASAERILNFFNSWLGARRVSVSGSVDWRLV